MKPTRAQRIEAAYHELLELPLEQRKQGLAGQSNDFKAEVLRLLAAGSQVSSSYLDGGAEEQAPERVAHQKGSVIGGCELLRHIGEGGMGTVFLARQSSPARNVAVKLMRPGRMSARAVRRFELEIKALGTLQHDNIARIYAAGTTRQSDLVGGETEVPYLVMEYIQGLPILEYAIKYGLSFRERIELFCQVCDAIQYAHYRGILHRDIKSENVLVTHGATTGAESKNASKMPGGRPKVLDFGVARPLGGEQDSDDAWQKACLETQAGDMVGSLSCMSPEQLKDAREVDARSDVYALGALLYGLLAKRLPLQLGGLSLVQALACIANEEPPLLGKIDSRLRGDLESIAAKALAKDRSQRYLSAHDLAHDLRLHLAGRPIHARSHSRWYILRRELQRQRGLVLGVALAFFAVGAFAVQASKESDRNQALAKAEMEAKLLAETFLAQSTIERGRLLGRMRKSHGEEVLWKSLFESPDSEQARWALREYYNSVTCLKSRVFANGAPVGIQYANHGKDLILIQETGRISSLDPDSLSVIKSFELGIVVKSYALSLDGQLLALGTKAGEVVLFDWQQGIPVSNLAAHTGSVTALGFQQQNLFSASTDGTLAKWNLTSGECMARVDPGAGRLIALALGEGGALAVAGERFVALWEAGTNAGLPKEVLINKAPIQLDGHKSGVHALAFSQSASVLWSAGFDRSLTRWDLRAQTHTAQRHSSGNLRLLDSHAGSQSMAVAGRWGFRIVDLEDGSTRRTYPIVGASCVELAPGGKHMLVGKKDGSLRMWSLEQAPHRRAWTAAAPPTSMAIAPAAASFVSGDGKGLVRHVDLNSGEELARWETAGGRVRVGFSPTGMRFAWTEEHSRTLKVVDATTSEMLLEVSKVLRNNTHSFAFHPLEDWIAVTSRLGEVECWKMGAEEPFRSYKTPGQAAIALAFSPNGKEIFILDSSDNAIHAFDVHSGLLGLRFASLGGKLRTLDVDPHGNTLAAASSSGAVYLWDSRSGSALPKLEGHEGSVLEVHFLRGTPGLLASHSFDGTLTLWNARTRQNLAEFEFSGSSLPARIDSNRTGQFLTLGSTGTKTYLLDLAQMGNSVAQNLDYALLRFGGESLSEKTLSSLRFPKVLGHQR